MANNKVIANSGNPFTAATDEIGGIDYAKMKLFSAVEDSVIPIGDSTLGSSAGIWVVPKIDLSMPLTLIDSAGLTIAATPYSTGDVLGNGWVIPNAAVAAGGYGRVQRIVLVDQNDVINGVAIWFFSKAVTFGTDNAAPSISKADAKFFQGKVLVSPEDMGVVRFGAAHSFSMPYNCNGTTNLYAYATTLSAHNQFAAVTDLGLNVGLVRD